MEPEPRRSVERRLAWPRTPDGPTPPLQPDIVLIVADDQRGDTLDATHSLTSAPVMPQLDALLTKRGVLFSNFYVSTPICFPSRASIFTGRYSHNHGVFSNSDPASDLVDTATIATALQGAGYRTAMLGKYINNYSALGSSPWYVPPGWTQWRAFPGQGQYFSFSLVERAGPGPDAVETVYGASDYSTDILATKAAAFIRETAPLQPYFLYLGLKAPHGEAAGAPIPATRDLGTYAALPPWAPTACGAITVDEPWRKASLEALQAADDAIATIMAAVEERARPVIVLYTSDNGFFWGEHGVAQGKGKPWEQAVHVPLVVWCPKLVPTPRTEPFIASNIDLAATLSELAGASFGATLDGESLVPVLSGTSPPGARNTILIEGWETGEVFGALRQGPWKYVEHNPATVQELYNLDSDPCEQTNVAGANPALLAALAAKLRVLRPDWPPLP
jgi:arylsulfatase A-like enzyme